MRLETISRKVYDDGRQDLLYRGEVKPGPVREVEYLDGAADAMSCVARVETFLSDLSLLIDDLLRSTDHRSIIIKFIGDTGGITEIIIDLMANRGAVLINVGHSSDRTGILYYDNFYAEYPGGPVDGDPHENKPPDVQRIFNKNWRAFTAVLSWRSPKAPPRPPC